MNKERIERLKKKGKRKVNNKLLNSKKAKEKF